MGPCYTRVAGPGTARSRRRRWIRICLEMIGRETIGRGTGGESHVPAPVRRGAQSPTAQLLYAGARKEDCFQIPPRPVL